MKKNIALLGSTGSIGTQTLSVVKEHPDLFNVSVLTAYNNYMLLIEQAKEFKPKHVVIVNESHYAHLKHALADQDIILHAGAKAIEDIVCDKAVDLVVTALVGFSGLKPTINAIKAKKNIALANKETLVVGGRLISDLCKKNDVSIFPVDSEHSAIYQVLMGEHINNIEKIYLTASGGPFRGRTKKDLKNVSVSDALRHPNWEMGRKISIDSATMMNKGLEVIEAHWLFGLSASKIEVVVHPESIIHSAVQFIDGSVKAQLGLPDMKGPIQFALGFPKRLPNSFDRFNFFDFQSLNFEKPDYNTFGCLNLAFNSINRGGNSPCVLNAANEVAVDYFLKEKISFLKIVDLIENCLEKSTFVENPSLDDLIRSDSESRNNALKFLT